MTALDDALNVLDNYVTDYADEYKHPVLAEALARIRAALEAQRWIPVSERLPDYDNPRERRVWARLEGIDERSGARWKRTAEDVIHHWPLGSEGADADGWVLNELRDLCEKHGATVLHVVSWQPLPLPPEDGT